jgi:hypothetical protein
MFSSLFLFPCFVALCGMPIADSQVTLWHRGDPLPLLPSGSDGVHGAALHRT